MNSMIHTGIEYWVIIVIMINYAERGGRVPADEDAYVLPVRDLFLALWKRWWIIVLVVVTLTGGIIGLSLMQPPVYEASIKILVGQQRGIAETPFDVGGLQDVTATVAEAVSSRPIAKAVIEQENLNTDPGTFLTNLEVSVIENTQFIEVNYRDSDPERAQRVVNTLGDVFSKRIAEVNPRGSVMTATVWEPAGVPGEPISPNPLRNGLVALMVGAVLGAGLALLLEFLDDSWRSPEEAEQVSGVPTFGAIPAFAVVNGVRRRARVVVNDEKIGREGQ
jgi:capsular polysaccharide biosynthesis protein